MNWISFDEVLKFIGALGSGGIAGLISGGASNLWRARVERRKRLDETRATRLRQWRSELRDPELRKRNIVNVPSWNEIRSFLSPETRKAERPIQVGGMISVVIPSTTTRMMRSPRLEPWDNVLDELAELEKTWGLI